MTLLSRTRCFNAFNDQNGQRAYGTVASLMSFIFLSSQHDGCHKGGRKGSRSIVDLAALAVTNAKECTLLAFLAGQTKPSPFLRTLKQLHVDAPSLLVVLYFMFDALNKAEYVT